MPGERAKLCHKYAPSETFCKINPVAHPDIKGAETYRDGIMNVIENAWIKTTVPTTGP